MVKSAAISRNRAGALPFCISAAAWVDLLGYGSMIGEADLSPIDPRAKSAVTRLRAFHRVVAEQSGRHFKTLVLNDGAVAYRDLSLRSNGVTHDFLQRAFNLFTHLNECELRNSWPGARMVLGLGFRARGSKRGMDYATARVARILERLDAGQLSGPEAVREAASIQRYSDSIPQLQANFAFTKAYVAETKGSRAGLAGARFFVDAAMFSGGRPPSWVRAADAIPFTDDRLGIACEFVPIERLTSPRGTTPPIPGLRDGLEIGEAIAPHLSLRSMIKAAR